MQTTIPEEKTKVNFYGEKPFVISSTFLVFPPQSLSTRLSSDPNLHQSGHGHFHAHLVRGRKLAVRDAEPER
jgi:hypothetical protein